MRPLFSDEARTHHILAEGAVPNRPPEFYTTTLSTTEIELKWKDDSGQETGFLIQRAVQGSTDYTSVVTTDANETMYIDSGLEGETAYLYRICTVGKGDIKSAFTGPVPGITMLFSPTSLKAKSTSPTQVELTWVDASSHETGYVIERKEAGDNDYTSIATLDADTGYYLDNGDLPDGLLPVTEYDYRIRAVGESDQVSAYVPFDPVTTQGRNYLRIVPLNGLTLQETIDKANPGDTITVMPDSMNGGPYKVNLVWDKKTVTLKSFGGPGVTTLDGERIESVLRITHSTGVLIEGFTITNGKAENGGGIFCSDSEITLRNNRIEDNISRREGGGVYLSSATVLIERNRIEGNEIQGTLLAKGGGIACNAVSGTITNNLIIGNEIGGFYSHGGGLSLHGGGTPLVTRNVIRENGITFGLYTFGGGIDVNGTLPEIADNFIGFNTANGGGGGISITGVDIVFVNNLVCRNTAQANGGGIQCVDASPSITNNTIAFNAANGQGGGISSTFASSKPVITNCIVWGNTAPVKPSINGGKAGKVTYSDVQDYVAGPGSINVDPQFVDPSGNNFHLLSGSQCIETGSNDAVTTTYPDLDGEPRIDQTVVDMGMDEHHDYDTAAGEYHVPASFDSIQTALDQANVTKVIVAPDCAHGGPYNENLNFSGKAVNVVSHAGATMTTLDGNRNGSVVVFESGEGSGAILDGFTITNGLATLQGGGIQITNGSSPFIRNNVVIANEAGLAGGGLSCDGDSSPVIDSNTLQGNSAGLGGGFYCKASIPLVVHNQLLGNLAQTGGGAALDDASLTFFNTLFVSNISDEEGGGIYVTGSDPSLGNCTFFGNAAGLVGGGVYAATPSSVTILHSIFSTDQADADPEIGDPDSLANVTYSCIAQENPWPGTGNISEDPNFWSRSSRLGTVAEDREFLLRQSYGGNSGQEYALSSCVDAGGDTAANVGLGSRTTTTENQADQGIVDLGFHYIILP